MMDFNAQLQKTGEFGIVEEVQQSIALISGLPTAQMNELVVFETGQLGSIFLIDRDASEILILSKEPVKTGARVARTGKALSIPVGPELLGKIINPLGESLVDDANFHPPTNERIIDTPPPGMSVRSTIKNPLLTGVSIIDMMIPLGKGQRELVIGDRKTGKTAFLLSALKSQMQLGSVGIYAAIGRKKADIKQVYDFFAKEGLLNRLIVVATTSNDSPSLIFQTPYAAMAIAEHIFEAGVETLVVMDDLSTHARFYREISLLAKRFPGREAYPGDIFYTHARLVERAGNYKTPKGEVSISVLPVVEIVEGDFTGYIATNIMGMTDGHIYFDSNVFYTGRRPAVNLPLSVTRVGRQAQTKLMRNINREVTTFLSHYEKMQSLSQFGAELTAETKADLKVGNLIYKLFVQPIGMVVPLEVQLTLFGLVWSRDESLVEEEISNYRDRLIKGFNDAQTKEMIGEIIKTDKIDELLENIKKHKKEIFSILGIEMAKSKEATPPAPVAPPVANTPST